MALPPSASSEVSAGHMPSRGEPVPEVAAAAGRTSQRAVPGNVSHLFTCCREPLGGCRTFLSAIFIFLFHFISFYLNFLTCKLLLKPFLGQMPVRTLKSFMIDCHWQAFRTFFELSTYYLLHCVYFVFFIKATYFYFLDLRSTS